MTGCPSTQPTIHTDQLPFTVLFHHGLMFHLSLLLSVGCPMSIVMVALNQEAIVVLMRSKVGGGRSQVPHGILVNSYDPIPEKAIFSWSLTSTGTPLCRSSLVNIEAPANLCWTSSISGSGYTSLVIKLFSSRQSTQSLISPELFLNTLEPTRNCCSLQ